jgi:hypothetical protein
MRLPHALRNSPLPLLEGSRFTRRSAWALAGDLPVGVAKRWRTTSMLSVDHSQETVFVGFLRIHLNFDTAP